MATDLSRSDDLDDLVLDSWFEVLGPDADPQLGFLENGGDSIGAVNFAQKICRATGIAIDFVDIIIEVDGVEAVHRLLQNGMQCTDRCNE